MRVVRVNRPGCPYFTEQEGKTAQQIVAEALELRKAFKEGRLNVNVESDNQTSNAEIVERDESLDNQSQQTVYEEISDKPSFEIDNSQAKEDYAVFSDSIIFNPANQETVESLSDELSSIVENINSFDRNPRQEIKQLVPKIISLCNEQPVSQQWNILAEITRRDSEVLELVVKCSGEEHSEWIFNLPQLLADAALDNPEELEWVNKRLRSQAMLLISAR
ncbi:MAG: hypothetical protein AAFX46_03880 [Cyanobacteria bacterium J06636_27]